MKKFIVSSLRFSRFRHPCNDSPYPTQSCWSIQWWHIWIRYPWYIWKCCRRWVGARLLELRHPQVGARLPQYRARIIWLKCKCMWRRCNIWTSIKKDVIWFFYQSILLTLTIFIQRLWLCLWYSRPGDEHWRVRGWCHKLFRVEGALRLLSLALATSLCSLRSSGFEAMASPISTPRACRHLG